MLISQRKKRTEIYRTQNRGATIAEALDIKEEFHNCMAEFINWEEGLPDRTQVDGTDLSGGEPEEVGDDPEGDLRYKLLELEESYNNLLYNFNHDSEPNFQPEEEPGLEPRTRTSSDTSVFRGSDTKKERIIKKEIEKEIEKENKKENKKEE